MDKFLFGKILGEIYRIQRRMDACPVKESTVYGLLNGFESVIDDEISSIGFVSKEDVSAVADVLDEYFLDEKKLEKLKGYYDIEPALERRGISRSKAMIILTYFKLNGQYTNVIEKFNSQHSPVECKTFEPHWWEL
jgi:hypothetical protein